MPLNEASAATSVDQCVVRYGWWRLVKAQSTGTDEYYYFPVVNYFVARLYACGRKVRR